MKLFLPICTLDLSFLIPFYFLSDRSFKQSQSDVSSMIDQFIKNTTPLPRYMEEGYSPLGRSPVVDALLADPFYMPTYAEAVSKLIKQNSQSFQLETLAASVFRAAGMPIRTLNRNSILAPIETAPDQFLKAFSEPIAKKLYAYWVAFTSIQKEVQTLLSVLTEEEKVWIKENYNLFFFEGQDSFDKYEFFTTDSPYPFKFFELASRIDLAKLNDCARKLSSIADDFYQSRKEFEQISLKEDFIWTENELTLKISQQNYVIHQEDVDFFIDLGGYNTIYSNAGGTGGSRFLALHLDLKGHNTYLGQNFVQGCGFLGVGLLMSCSGYNTYQANSYSQGCGLFGAGFLVSLEGQNQFHLNFGGQSFALFGSSLLWNKGGKNSYLANYSMAQSATSTLGVAFLIDNEGENIYIAGTQGKEINYYEGIGQGGSSGVRAHPWLNNPSLYGGLSFLYLGEGSNKLKTGWLGQGSAYFLGIGITVAEGSNDLFEASYDAQGQGLHLAGGLLVKKGQFNQFKGGWGSLGVAADRSVGMFLSLGGNNIYEGTDQSMGSSRKPKALGVFIAAGGNNSYSFQNLSNTRLQFPQSPNQWSRALFVELGQDSHYPNVDEFDRGNNKQWGIEKHSLGISTASLGESGIADLLNKFPSSPQIDFPFDPIQGWATNVSYQPIIGQPENVQDLAQEISTANYDRRRQIYETLDLIRFKNRKIQYDLSYLLEIPTQIPEDAFNYAVLWALRNKDKVDLKAIKNALDSNSFTSDYARKMAVSLVGTFWTPDVVPLLTQVMLKDKSEEIRYYAALALTLHANVDITDSLKQGIKSNSEVVRYAIAKGLQESSHPDALSLVVSLFHDPSFYVRRAAGLTALSLGNKEGVTVVLETLQYESLDTTDNYGNNIYKQLSNYLNVDFGLDKQAWIDWWNEKKKGF